VLAGAVAGNLRSIALSTSVTLLVPEGQRDRANGMVGTVTGVSIVVTSVLSGLAVGQLGMGWALGFAVGATALALAHLLTIRVPEDFVEHTDAEHSSAFDFKGALAAVRLTPGLLGLIGFAAFNNLLGGVFMSLMDAYGLSLVSVEAWGILWAVVSLGFVVGGIVVARRGLGSRPLRVILIGNALNWTVCIVFPLQSSIVMLAVGMLIWMSLIPAIEAAEQTVLQQVVPFDHQGRVFGFAQTVENAASPLTSFMIGPIAQFVFIPFMTDGAGVDLIGGWFGVGSERGLALIFTLAGVFGIAATWWASRSGWYRNLSAAQASVDARPPVAVD
jgi:MFS transporter, DHA3 family, multidrug efflux protein